MDNLSNLPSRGFQSISSFSKSPEMPEITEELSEKSVKRIEATALSLKKIAQLEANLEEMRKNKEVEMSRWTAKIAQIEASLKIAKLEADLVDERERNRELERKIAETKRKDEDLEAQLSEQARCKLFRSEMSLLTAKMAQIEANLMGKIAKLEADLFDERERNRELERKIAETKRGDQNMEVREGKTKIGELEGKINALQSKNSGLETQIQFEKANKTAEIAKLQADLRTQDTKVRDGKAKIGELDGKINALQSKISGFETQIQFERGNKTAKMVKLQADLVKLFEEIQKSNDDFGLGSGWMVVFGKNRFLVQGLVEVVNQDYLHLKAIDQRMTFDQAVAYCASRKSHLVSIHSQEENDFVQKLAKTVASSAVFWIGLKKNPNKGNAFEWTDGSSVDFRNWKVGEPDSNTHTWLDSGDGKWWYAHLNYQSRFICKRSSHF